MVVGPVVVVAPQAPELDSASVSEAPGLLMHPVVLSLVMLQEIAPTVAAGLKLLLGPVMVVVGAPSALETAVGPEVTVDTVVGPAVVVRVVSLVTTPLVVTTVRLTVVVVVAASLKTVVVSTSYGWVVVVVVVSVSVEVPLYSRVRTLTLPPEQPLLEVVMRVRW